MVVTIENISELSDGAVTFCSVKLGDCETLEFEKFDEKDFPGHIKERQILYAVIEEMRHRGAKQHYFKNEGPANALPRVDKLTIEKNAKDYGLRLYCIRIRNDLVMLLNGGIKTKQNPLDCPNVREHFRSALTIARKLDLAYQEDYIEYTENGIIFKDDEFKLEV